MIQIGSPEYQKWSKHRKLRYRKRLQRLGLYNPKPPPEPQPGSYKQRHYARYVLSCIRIDDTSWKVWGGQSEHIIMEIPTKNGTGYRCDCELFTNEKRVCSHIIKIILQEETKT